MISKCQNKMALRQAWPKSGPGANHGTRSLFMVPARSNKYNSSFNPRLQQVAVDRVAILYKYVNNSGYVAFEEIVLIESIKHYIFSFWLRLLTYVKHFKQSDIKQRRQLHNIIWQNIFWTTQSLYWSFRQCAAACSKYIRIYIYNSFSWPFTLMNIRYNNHTLVNVCFCYWYWRVITELNCVKSLCKHKQLCGCSRDQAITHQVIRGD